MKDLDSIGTLLGVLFLIFGTILEYLGVENTKILFFIYILGVIFLFIKPILQFKAYLESKRK